MQSHSHITWQEMRIVKNFKVFLRSLQFVHIFSKTFEIFQSIYIYVPTEKNKTFFFQLEMDFSGAPGSPQALPCRKPSHEKFAAQRPTNFWSKKPDYMTQKSNIFALHLLHLYYSIGEPLRPWVKNAAGFFVQPKICKSPIFFDLKENIVEVERDFYLCSYLS